MENRISNFSHDVLVSNNQAVPTSANHSLLVQVPIAVILAIFILIAITGNILVCIAICTDRNLRHIGNTFVASLAIADLLVGIIVMPMALFNDLLGYWSLPQFLCGIWVSFDIMGSTASILNLCAISLDRYIHIKDPLHYSATVTPRVVIPSVILIWFLSTLISFVPLNLGWHKPLQQADTALSASDMRSNVTEILIYMQSLAASNNDSRVDNGIVQPLAVVDGSDAFFQCNLEINPMYALTSSIISFYFPCLIMLFIYLRLYFEARRHVKSVKEMAHIVYYNNCNTTASNNQLQATTAGLSSRNNRGSNGSRQRTISDAVANAQNRMISEHKAAVTLGIIVSVFLICLAPFFAINIIHANCQCIPMMTFKALTWLGYCNSAFNPIIYSIFNQDFRKAFRKLLQFHKCCTSPMDSTSRDQAFSYASGNSAPVTPTVRSRMNRDQQDL